MDIGSLIGSLVLNDEFTAPLSLAMQKLQGSASAIEQAGASFAQAGVALTAGITLPITAAAGASLKFSGDFESSMAKLVSLAGVSGEQLEGVKQHILDLAPAVGVGPQALAEAMTKISSTVSDADLALEILDASARGSAAGMGSALDVAGALTSVINSYPAGSITAAHAMDVLTQAVKDGGAEAKELAPTLSNVVPIAAQMGVSFEEVAANVATVTKLGTPAAEAITQLTSVMAAMLHDTNKSSEALANIGLTMDDVRKSVQERGLAQTLQDLSNQFKGNEQELIKIFPRIEAFRNIMATAGSQAETYAKVLDNVKRSSEGVGVAAGAFAAVQDTQVHKWAELSAAVQVAAIQFGDALAPTMKAVLDAAIPLMETVINMVDGFGQLPQPLISAAVGVGGLVVALGPLLTIAGTLAWSWAQLIPLFAAGSTGLGLLTGAVSVLTGPIGIAAAAAFVLYEGLKYFGLLDPIISFFQDLGSVISGVTVGAFNMVKGVIIDVASAIGDKLQAALEYIGLPLSKVTGFFKSLGDTITAWVMPVVKGLVDWLKSLREQLGFLADKYGTVPAMIEAASASIEEQRKAVKTAKEATEQFAKVTASGMTSLNAYGKSTDGASKAAQGLGAHTVQTKKQMEDQAASVKKTADAWAQYRSVASNVYDTLGAKTVESIKWELARKEANQSVIASVYGVTEAQVKAVEQLRNADIESKKLAESTKSLTTNAIGAAKGFGAFGSLMPDLSKQAHDVMVQFNLLDASFNKFSGSTASGSIVTFILEPLKGLPNVVAQGTQQIDQARKSMVSFGEATRSVLSEVPDLFIKAFTGGGGVSGALSALGTKIAKSLSEGFTEAQKAAVGFGTAAAAAVGQAAGLSNTANAAISVGTGLAGATLAATGLVTSTVALGAATLGIGAAAVGVGLLWKHFTGVSAAVKEAREQAEKFETAIHATLTATQLAEAGGQGWAATVIGVRDAYKAVGLSAQQAEEDVEALWAATNEGPEATKAAMDKISAAFSRQKEILDAIHDAGYTTQQDLQALANKARDVYDYMVRVGTYSAQDVQAAWEASAHAQALALGDASAVAQEAASQAGFRTRAELEETAAKAKLTYEYMRDSGLYTAAEVEKAWKATQDAQDLAYDDATSSIKGLVDQYSSLAASIADEAPEEIMGVIEAQTRGQMEALKRQGEEQLKQSGMNAEEAARAWEAAISGIHIEPIHVQVIYDFPTIEAPEEDQSQMHSNSNYAAGGGYPNASGFVTQHLAAGGYGGPRGTDKYNVWVGANERVLSPSQSRDWERNSSNSSSSDSQVIQDSLDRLPATLADSLSKAVARAVGIELAPFRVSQ